MNDIIKISPIGSVEKSGDRCSISIFKDYRDGLTGLDEFSHAVILWWASLFDEPQYRRIIKFEKPYKKGPDVIGIFATRSPIRPNPVAISSVYISGIDMEKGIISIPYIDAEDGTPVLDIKPYHPSEDRIKNIRMPKWCSHWPQWSEDSSQFDRESEFNF